MKDCNHSFLVPGNEISVTESLDDWLGPVLAIIECDTCSERALMHLVAWQGERLSERIYAVRSLAQEAVDIYLRNISRDYCDLTRKQSETDALIQASDGSARLVRADTPELRVSAVAAGSHNPRPMEWQAVDPKNYGHWAALLESS